MGFLEATVSLDRTKFKQEALAEAQKFLSAIITRHDPGWLDNPVGPLSSYWKKVDVESVCFLINFADTLGRLERNITQKSVSIFVSKLKCLLRAKDRRQFEETFQELSFARVLCEFVSPISFEPFVPVTLEDPGNKPRSSDYAIRLPDGDVLIEITTFYFGALESWIRTTKLFSDQLRHLLERRGVSRTINITFPLEFNSLSLLPRASLTKLIDEICRTERGKKNILLRRKEGILEWEPILIFDKSNQIFKKATEGTIKSKIGFAFGFQKRLLKEDHNELFLNSLRNKLKRKRKQSSETHPYLIALGLGHYSIQVDGVMAALRERIWPNSNYNWLTGLLIFSPVSGFLKSDPPPTLNYSVNPSAKVAPTECLIDLLGKKARFHLRDGEYCSE